MSNHHDVIVVGVGGMGSATCYALARRGVRVLGLEQFGIAHDRGSSHGHTRMIRLAYYEHPDYVPLLRRAYEKWREIETVSGEPILHITGGIYAGASDGELVRQSANAARQHGIEHETLDREQIRERFPQFRLPDHFVGLFEPAAGFVRPELAVSTFANHATLAGAEIHVNEPVRAWSAESGAIAVTTDLASYTADVSSSRPGRGYRNSCATLEFRFSSRDKLPDGFGQLIRPRSAGIASPAGRSNSRTDRCITVRR